MRPRKFSQTVVITGANSGLGKALVDLYANDKNTIVFAGSRHRDLIDERENVFSFYIDMLKPETIKQAAEYIKSGANRIDVLLNVAGIVVAGAIETIETERLRQQFEVNVFAHLDFTKNLITHLEGGKVINISSMASFGHFPFISPYGASKRAMDILFNSLLLETHHNVRIISIKAGVISTPIWVKSVESNVKDTSDYIEYKKELNFLKKNALSNTNKGMKVEKAAQFIRDISLKKFPKSSYTMGFDAQIAQILSIFPQDIINFIVKFFFNLRLKRL